MRLILTATGADGRMQRYGDGRDASLLDKNAALLANNVYLKLGVRDDRMGDVCVYNSLAVLASGSVDGIAASYSQQGAKNNGEQTKDTVLFSVKGCSTKEVKGIIWRANQRAGNITGGDTAIIRFETMMYKTDDRRGFPTDKRDITVEVGLVGEESKFQALLKHGLITDDICGVVLTGKFTPHGGYDVSKFSECIGGLAIEATLPYFSGCAPEILSIARAHPFGVTVDCQATNAVLITFRVPPNQKLLKLPTAILSPTGMFDHPSHHEEPGKTPQYMPTNMQWFLNGHKTSDGNFEVRKGDAGSEQVKYQMEHGARPETRQTRRVRRHENAVKQRQKGADISDLQGPVRQRHVAGEKAKANGRTSRSRSRSPQRGSGEGARGKAVRQASQMQGAMMGLRMGATPSGAAAQYAVSAEDAELFKDAELFSGVPGMGTEPETSVPGASPTAPGEAGTSELRQAADTQLPSSTPPSPAFSPMET